MFDKFKSLHIAVLGDLIMDEYIYGDVQRISPEAPIPIVQLTRKEWRPGGAANVALNLNNLGVRTSLIGVAGRDYMGDKLTTLINELNLRGNIEIIKCENRITTCKTRVVAHNQHIVRIDDEETTPVNEDVSSQIIQKLIKLNSEKPLDAVILQDYEKGLFHSLNIPEFISTLKNLNIKIIVDPKNINFWLYKGVDIIKPNKKEAENALNRKIKLTEEGLSKAVQEIEEKLHNKLTVITLSENGIYLNAKQNNIWQHSEVKEIVDVCGAGDAVISVIAAAWCSGSDLEEMATISNVAGALVCGERGVAAVDLEALKEAYNSR